MSKFTVGTPAVIGTVDNLPDNWDTPIPVNVICVDAIALHDIRVIVLAPTSMTNPLEQVRQFNTDGLCINAMISAGNPNAAQYLESNLYPVDEATTTDACE